MSYYTKYIESKKRIVMGNISKCVNESHLLTYRNSIMSRMDQNIELNKRINCSNISYKINELFSIIYRREKM